jgi:hypothetical protein
MQTQPTLDVVLPTHNVASWLQDCLDSLIAQTFGAWRAYVILDDSTDDSERIARKYADRDSRIEVHLSPGRGVASARNYGFELAKSRYVAFVDPDDMLVPTAFEILTSALERTGSDLATGHALEFDKAGSGHPYWTMDSGLFDVAADATSLAIEPRLILDHTTWNKVYRREFLRLNEIIFPEGVSIGEDVHHTLQAICLATTIDVVPATVYRHRVRPHSLTSRIRSDNSILEWVGMTRDVEELVRGTGLPQVRQIWTERMLTHEAWTRARQIHLLESERAVTELLELLSRLIAAQPPGLLSGLPLLLRWGYEVIDVAPATSLPRNLSAALAQCEVQLAGVTALPEFERFAHDFRLSGVGLRARLWRESLFLPALRLLHGMPQLARHRALARVIVFQHRFVAEHALLPDEIEFLRLATDGCYDELSRRFLQRMSLSASVTKITVRPANVDLTVQVVASDAATVGEVKLVAVSLDNVAGVVKHLETRRLPTNDGVTVTSRIRYRDLRPLGKWAIAVRVAANDHDYYISLTLRDSANNWLPQIFRPLAMITPRGAQLTVEGRPRLLARIYRRFDRWLRDELTTAPGSEIRAGVLGRSLRRISAGLASLRMRLRRPAANSRS